MSTLKFSVPGIIDTITLDDEHRGAAVCAFDVHNRCLLHALLMDKTQEYDLIYASFSKDFGILRRYLVPVDENDDILKNADGALNMRADLDHLIAFISVPAEFEMYELLDYLNWDYQKPTVLFLYAYFESGKSNWEFGMDVMKRLSHTKRDNLYFVICHPDILNVVAAADNLCGRHMAVSYDNAPEEYPPYEYVSGPTPVYGRIYDAKYTTEYMISIVSHNKLPVGYVHNISGDVYARCFDYTRENVYMCLSNTALDKMSSMLEKYDVTTTLYQGSCMSFDHYPQASVNAVRFNNIYELTREIIRLVEYNTKYIVCAGIKWSALVNDSEDRSELTHLVSYMQYAIQQEGVHFIFITGLNCAPMEILALCNWRITDADADITRASILGTNDPKVCHRALGSRVIVTHDYDTEYMFLPEVES